MYHKIIFCKGYKMYGLSDEAHENKKETNKQKELCKNLSSCGITGAMKNHFGSLPSPRNLHEGMDDQSYIADICNTPSIRDKVRVSIADALFAYWHKNVWAPRPWKTFPQESPHSLILGTDPVALDSVMLDISWMRSEPRVIMPRTG